MLVSVISTKSLVGCLIAQKRVKGNLFSCAWLPLLPLLNYTRRQVCLSPAVLRDRRHWLKHLLIKRVWCGESVVPVTGIDLAWSTGLFFTVGLSTMLDKPIITELYKCLRLTLTRLFENAVWYRNHLVRTTKKDAVQTARFERTNRNVIGHADQSQYISCVEIGRDWVGVSFFDKNRQNYQEDDTHANCEICTGWPYCCGAWDWY